MLRNKPSLKYCGLTVILSNPSRFDKASLLSAGAGTLFNDCLQPQFNQMQVDVRLMEDESPFLPDTKCLLLLGESALHKYVPETRNNTLNEMRGSPFYYKDIPCIGSFFPQDAADIKGYEQNLNKESKDYSGSEDYEDEEEGDQKAHSGTKRANYAFWLQRDIWKCKHVIGPTSNRTWPVEQEPIYKTYPRADEIINVLTKTKNEFLYFDMETDYEEQNLLCFSFSFDGKIVYSVPVLDYNYRHAYPDLYFLIRALSVAIRDNTIVAHNGSGFDFFVLGAKYHIPVKKCYDTMLAMRRCFPDIEISLGHCMSYWTYQKFHKDTDSQAYRTYDHMVQKLKYCGRDVFGMYLVKKAIDEYSRTIPGLSDSIVCANNSIIPYLTCTIQGIRYSQKKVDELKNENDRLMMQYNRIVEILIGPLGMEKARASIKGGKKGLLPGSNKQCCNYFHEQLGYPVLFRSDTTQEPSLGKKVMYQLQLRYEDNPVIKFILLYRQVQKEYGALKFRPFKDDNNKILPRRGPQTEEEKLASKILSMH